MFVDATPRALIAKTKKQPITRAGGETFEGPTFLPHVVVLMGIGARGLKFPLLNHTTSFAN